MLAVQIAWNKFTDAKRIDAYIFQYDFILCQPWLILFAKLFKALKNKS